jgi:hypothetical protein
MKITNEAREQLIGHSLAVLGVEVEDDGKNENDVIWLHLATGCSVSIAWHPIKGLVVKSVATSEADPTRSGWCTCPVRPFGNPPVFAPDCPQHKDLIR